MAELGKTFEIHHNVFEGSTPYSISSNVTILSPANAVLSDALSDAEEEPENDTIYKQLKFVEIDIQWYIIQ